MKASHFSCAAHYIVHKYLVMVHKYLIIIIRKLGGLLTLTLSDRCHLQPYLLVILADLTALIIIIIPALPVRLIIISGPPYWNHEAIPVICTLGSFREQAEEGDESSTARIRHWRALTLAQVLGLTSRHEDGV